MSAPHKWRKEIIAWANGDVIQYRVRPNGEWIDVISTPKSIPAFFDDVYEYRVKPAPIDFYGHMALIGNGDNGSHISFGQARPYKICSDTIKITVIGDTITAVELVK